MDTIVLCAVLISVSLLAYDVNSQQEEGDACDGENGQKWTCKKFQRCPSAVAEIKYKRPKHCGFTADSSLLVCCNPGSPTPNKPQKPQTQTPPPNKPPPNKPPPNKQPQINHILPDTISGKKCREYQKYVYKQSSYKPLAIEVDYGDEEELNSNKATDNTCGIKEEPLIIDGKPANPREFPHQARIGYEVPISGGRKKIEWKCAGSLISERFILTAGHCLQSKNGPARWVRTGDLDFNSETDTASPQQIRVARRIPHPDYEPPLPYNDIGLLKLERDVKLDEFNRPACLHREHTIPERYATASGWGKTENASESSLLLKVKLDIIDRDKCNAYYKDKVTITDRAMICAGDFVGRKNTCQGDSGGPLQIQLKSPYCMHSIIGVTSIGRGECWSRNPGVYTRVSRFINWIEKEVWP